MIDNEPQPLTEGYYKGDYPNLGILYHKVMENETLTVHVEKNIIRLESGMILGTGLEAIDKETFDKVFTAVYSNLLVKCHKPINEKD
jgi:hypothetical protein